jgi:homoserine acetyltransferase
VGIDLSDSVRPVPIAGAARHSAQNIAFHEVGRQAIMADPDGCGALFEPCRNPSLACGRAWRRTSFVGGGAAPQIRPQLAGRTQ